MHIRCIYESATLTIELSVRFEFAIALPGLEPGQGNDAFTGYEPGEIPISPERDKISCIFLSTFTTMSQV